MTEVVGTPLVIDEIEKLRWLVQVRDEAALRGNERATKRLRARDGERAGVGSRAGRWRRSARLAPSSFACSASTCPAANMGGSVPYLPDASSYQAALAKTHSGRLLAIDFTATWCGPCKQIGPRFEAMAMGEFPFVDFAKIDVRCRDSEP